MEYRIEHDTMGEVRVPAEHFWGAQTERSLENFRIGTETIPREVIHAFAVLKSAAATANHALGKLPEAEAQAITDACRDICDGKYPEEFPLKVWQTGSGSGWQCPPGIVPDFRTGMGHQGTDSSAAGGTGAESCTAERLSGRLQSGSDGAGSNCMSASWHAVV